MGNSISGFRILGGWSLGLMLASGVWGQDPTVPLLDDRPPEPPTEIRVRGVVGTEQLPRHERFERLTQDGDPPPLRSMPQTNGAEPLLPNRNPNIDDDPPPMPLAQEMAEPRPDGGVRTAVYSSRLEGLRGLDVNDPPVAGRGEGIRTVSEESVALQPAVFKQVEPGVTTANDLNKLWDVPREVKSVQGVERRTYDVPPFERVEVDMVDGVVRAVVVTLTESVPAASLASESGLSGAPPVIVTSHDGEMLGQAFPERGVLFTFDPNAGNAARPLVAQIVFEEIQPEAFVLRAEANLVIDYRKSLVDVERALAMDPRYNRAHWIKAQVLAAGGDFERAVSTMQKVVSREPDEPHYRVTFADVLEHAGRNEMAIQQLLRVVELAEGDPLLQAQVLLRLGNHAASGGQRDLKEALELHQEALKLALPLVGGDTQPATQFAAQDVLIECYLAIANDIAWGDYDNKTKAVPQWLDRARMLSESQALPPEFVQQYQFRLGSKALSAYLGMNQPLPDDFYPETIFRSGQQLIERIDDPMRLAQMHWSLGNTMHEACQLYSLANEHQKAMRCGEKAVEHMQAGFEVQRQLDPAASYRLGRSMFRVGAIASVGGSDHRQAITWYEKAMPYLDRPLPATIEQEMGKLGETFVSMAISYWQVDKKQKAVELTDKGRRLMEQAVEAGHLPSEKLNVPYRNLASMHRQLGQTDQATRFDRMAQRP